MMETSTLISSQVSLVLDLPPSCIQFCPAHPKYFVVGTYNLEKNVTTGEESVDNDEGADDTSVSKTPQSRNGSLIVFKVEGNDL
jgi:diphthamide biosynthesis protein 7